MGAYVGGTAAAATAAALSALTGTIATLDALLVKLKKYFGLALRKDAAIATDAATELSEINTNYASGAGAYTSTTDALEAIRDKETDIETDTAEIGAAGAGLTALGDTRLANLDATVSTRATPAQVNTEVVDALATDTYAEPAQGAPAATTSLAAKIGYLYKFLRNRKTQTSTTLSVYADDATTVDQKSTVSDNGTTYDQGEIVSGP